MILLTSLGSILYVASLLYIAKVLSGVLKGIVSAIIYGFFAVLIVYPLIYLININQPELMQGDNQLLINILISYAVIVTPGFIYLFSKIGALRSAGYFKPPNE